MESGDVRSPAARRKDRPWAPGRGTIVLAALVAVAAAVLNAWSTARPPVPTLWHRYPEVARVPPEASAALRKIPGWDHAGDPFELTARVVPTLVESADQAEQVLDRLGPSAPWALLRYLLERSEALPRGMSSFRDPAFDARGQAPGSALSKRPTPETDRVLLRVVADREVHVEVRAAATVALCRAGNTSALDPLVDRLLDGEEDETLRRQILLRLPRIGAAPPPRLDELLFVPWYELDREAAAVLAATGDVDAPSLVAAALREIRTRDGRAGVVGAWLGEPALLGHVCDGAVRISRGDPDVTAAAEAVRTALARVTRTGLYTAEDRDETPIREFDGAFDAWLAAHPEVFDTEFERGRAAYRDSERRTRESATTSVDAILVLGDDAWDLAAALLLLEGPARRIDDHLDVLDRVATLLRPEVAAAATPRAKIDVLTARLLPRHVSIPDGADRSALTTALRHRAGNCLGSTALFLSLGDRLGLPLHAVSLPGHVFVRWDDGETRINVETTAGGTELSDAAYADSHGVGPRLGASGRYLRNLTRREFLAAAHSNRAAGRMGAGRHAEALPFCDEALRLDPGCPEALLNRAVSLACVVPPLPGSEVLDAVGDAERSAALTPTGALALVRALVLAGCADEALALVERRRALGEGGAGLDTADVETMLAAGRAADAAARLGPLVAAEPRSVVHAAIEVDAARAVDPANWRAVLASASERTGRGEDLRLEVVERWVRGARRDADACLDAATALLDEVAGVDEALAWARRAVQGTTPEDRLPIEPRNVPRYFGLRAAAFDRRGDGAKAEEFRRRERELDGFPRVVIMETIRRSAQPR